MNFVLAGVVRNVIHIILCLWLVFLQTETYFLLGFISDLFKYEFFIW